MRPVNLLPARYRPARASGERPGIGYAALGALAVVLLMVVLYVVTDNGINDAKEKTVEAQNETAAAQARIGQLQAYGDFATLKASREAAVKSIAQLRFDYERLMREMALVLPHDSYLTSFASTPGGGAAAAPAAPTGGTATAAGATGTGPTVAMAGCSPTHPDVATAIVRLRKLHNVVDVDLSSSTKAGEAGAGSSGGVCPVAWSATLTFDAETPEGDEQSVPARLGGGQ